MQLEQGRTARVRCDLGLPTQQQHREQRQTLGKGAWTDCCTADLSSEVWGVRSLPIEGEDKAGLVQRLTSQVPVCATDIQPLEEDCQWQRVCCYILWKTFTLCVRLPFLWNSRVENSTGSSLMSVQVPSPACVYGRGAIPLRAFRETLCVMCKSSVQCSPTGKVFCY